jgi:hypothetical protein
MLAGVWTRRLIAPAIATVAIMALAEAVIQTRFSPSFWDRSSWLMHDPYRGGESFDRVVLYEKLSKLLAPDVKIISVGDSSGLFSLQPTIINRYTHGFKYVNLSTGANQGFAGHKGNAEFALRTVPGIKYVVLYMYPQLVPSERLFARADLAPIVYENLVGLKSKIMPPSAGLSAAAKALVFEGRRARASDPLSNHKVALEFSATVEQTLGWVPEHDVRFDRVDGRSPFYSDRRRAWYHHLGFSDPSTLNVTLRDFRDMVKSYGAELVIAFAPVPPRIVSPNDFHTLAALRESLARFEWENPDVIFPFPFLTPFGAEKFGNFNHAAREFSHLSSARLGAALGELVANPNGRPRRALEFDFKTDYPPITWSVQGPADPALRDAAMAFYLYAATGEDRFRTLISKRVLDIVDQEQPFAFALHDTRQRVASLAARKIALDYDISSLTALPIDVKGQPHCNVGQATQWASVSGTLVFKYASPNADRAEPVLWPASSKIFIPTILEDGIRKFDGYCPEPSLANAVPHLNRVSGTHP